MVDGVVVVGAAETSNPAEEALREVVIQLREELRKIFDEFVPTFGVDLSQEARDHILANAHSQAVDDLKGLLARDPAAMRSPLYVLRSYTSFRAVFLHRLAHQVLLASLRETSARLPHGALSNPALPLPLPDHDHSLTLAARRISERAKIQTRVDIHPAARIGCPFVLDHGAGTVIGETACVGRNCYFLQDVVLGAANIDVNPPHDRHPKVGDDVIMAGSVRAFGNIKIGTGARIHGLAIISHDIPPNAHVRVQTFLQIIEPRDRSGDPTLPVLYAVLPGPDGLLTVLGENLDAVSVGLVNQELEMLSPSSELHDVLLRSSTEICLRIRSPLEMINAMPSALCDLPPRTTNRVWGVCLTENSADRPVRMFFTVPDLQRHLLR